MNTHPETSSPESLMGHYAGFITRLVAFSIDLVVVSVTLVFLTYFANSTLDMLQIQNQIRLLSRYFPNLIIIYNFLTSPLMSGVYSFIFIVSYYIFFWTVAGQTIGKGVMGIKIIPQNGGKMSVLRSIRRYVGYFISALSFGLGFLWILVDNRRNGWHDKIAGTCVVYVWDARSDETFLIQATEEFKIRRKALQGFLKRNPRIKDPDTSQPQVINNDNLRE